MSCGCILLLNVLLLGIGVFIVLNRSSIIFIIIGMEMMIQATISNLIVFNRLHATQLEGHVLAVFITAISVCEMVLLLAIFLQLYRKYKVYDIKR